MSKTITEKKIMILEIYEKLVEDGIWNEMTYLTEVNNINKINEKELDFVLWYLQTEDGEY